MADEENQGRPQDEQEPVEAETGEDPVDEDEEDDDAESSESAEPTLLEKLKETIEVAVEDVGTLRKKLTITIPSETIGEQFDEQYTELRNEALVPGFRKGRAPRRLLEKRFGGEVKETLGQQFIALGLQAATEKVDLKVLGDPQFWATEKEVETQTLVSLKKAISLISIPDDGPLVYSCEVEIRPEFDLPEIKGIPLTKPQIEVTDADVNEQVERLRNLGGTLESVDGPVQADDVLMADIKLTSEGTLLKEQKEARLAARPQMVDGVVLDKLGEVLVGAVVGDIRTITSQIPDTYIKEEYRGKPVDFEFVVRQIQRLNVPPLDDELVKRWGFENEQELRDWVRKDLDSRAGERIREDLARQVQQYLIEKTTLDLPPSLSEKQIEMVVLRRLLEMYGQGVPEEETQKHLDELRTGARDVVLRELKLAFIMEKLAEEYKVEVTEGEINAYVAEIARQQGQRFDRVRDQLIKRDAIGDLYVRIRDGKIVEQLIANAQIAGDEETTASEEATGGEAESATDSDAT